MYTVKLETRDNHMTIPGQTLPQAFRLFRKELRKWDHCYIIRPDGTWAAYTEFYGCGHFEIWNTPTTISPVVFND
jgi:hypothetical protein